jgi:hypothetical protein
MSTNDVLPLEARGLQKRYGHLVAVGRRRPDNPTATVVDVGGGTRPDAATADANSPTPVKGAPRC